MPNLNAPNITVAITAIDETSPELNKARASIQSFSNAGKTAGDGVDYSLRKARESARGLGEELGVHLPRFVSTFIAESSLVGPALSTAFSAIAVVGLIEVLAKVPSAIEKIIGAISKWDDASKKAYENLVAANQKQLSINDDILKHQLLSNALGLEGSAKEFKTKQDLVLFQQKLNQELADQIRKQNEIQAQQDRLRASLGPFGFVGPGNLPLRPEKAEAQALEASSKNVHARIDELREKLRQLQLVEIPDAGAHGLNVAAKEAEEAAKKILETQTKNLADIGALNRAAAQAGVDEWTKKELEFANSMSKAWEKALSPDQLVQRKALQTITAIYAAYERAFDEEIEKELKKANEAVLKITQGQRLPALVNPSIQIPRPNFADAEAVTALEDKLKRLHAVVEGFGQGFDQMFTGIAQGTRSASDAFKAMGDAVFASVGHMITQLIVAYFWTKLLSAFSGIGQVGQVPTITAPIPDQIPLVPIPHASGGPVIPGMPYLVGERGPELFVSGRAGQIVPNGGFGGASVQVNIINQSSQPVNASVSQPKFDGEKYVIGVVLKDFSQNGPLRKALGSR